MTEQRSRAARLNSWGEGSEPGAVLFYSQSKPKPPPMALAASLCATANRQNEQNVFEACALVNTSYYASTEKDFDYTAKRVVILAVLAEFPRTDATNPDPGCPHP